jgi:nicotinamide-nucleotide amidase
VKSVPPTQVAVEILSVGDEILAGTTTNTNAGFIARTLAPLGFPVRRVTEVGDVAGDIQAATRAALAAAPVLIVTGGLGPTPDDHTKEDIAELFADPLERDDEILEGMRQRFAARGLSMPAVNEKQAWMPRSAQAIANPVGSAPGVHWSRSGAEIFLLPGVPPEMKAMLQESVVPCLRATFPTVRAMRTAVFRTTGKGESHLLERIEDLVRSTSPVQWAFYPSWHGVDIRLGMPASDAPEARHAWDAACSGIRRTLGEYLFSETAGETLEEVVGRLLLERGATLATAESCTGGLVGKRLTDVPGSSAWYNGGFVTYSNRMKEEWLQVPHDALETEGAVSAAVAACMAVAARRRAATTYAVSLTGIAGPTGGTADKPVGLVYIGLATPEGVRIRRVQYGTRRDFNRQFASQAALDMVRRSLLGFRAGDAFPLSGS